MASGPTTETIIEAVRKKLIRLCPRGGWPPYVRLTIDLACHNGEIVDPPEVTIRDKTKTKENDAES